MNQQRTLADLKPFEKYRKATRREKFLHTMEKIVPWKKLCELIEPFYPKKGRGRAPVGVERMLRIHFLQHWFALSDPAAEEILYDVDSMRRFVGIDLGKEPVPDETTICKFRHLLESNGLGEKIFEEVNLHLEEQGVRLSKGTIVDATIISAPSSTKNAEKKRDPEMRSTKKGNQYYFGMKAHVGVDKETKTVHTLITTSANVHDSRVIGDLLRGDESEVYGDSAYMGKTKEIKKRAPCAADLTHMHGCKNRKLTEEEIDRNRELSRTRSRVEHIFLVVKRIFGFDKVRYRGLAKNASFLNVQFALANIYMVRDRLLGSLSPI